MQMHIPIPTPLVPSDDRFLRFYIERSDTKGLSLCLEQSDIFGLGLIGTSTHALIMHSCPRRHQAGALEST